jgi:calcineurin-like phosphoesterase family protein
MKSTCLVSICFAMLFWSSAHAQTNGFPPLPPVPKTGQLVDDPNNTQFTFIAAGDNRPSGDVPTQPPTLAKVLKNARRYKPLFAIWSGDTIAGFRKAGEPIHHKTLTTQYEEFFKVAATAGVPIFNSPGNHEMDSVEKDGNSTTETPDVQMQQLYLKVMKYPAGAPAYGAFNYGNSRFIAVDTEEPVAPLVVRSEGKTVGKLKLDPGFVSPEQIQLLTNDLDANKDKAHIFVFMHHPIIPAKSGSQLDKQTAEKLKKLFASYKNVSYVIAAHEHIYFNATGTTLNPPPRTKKTTGGPGYLVSGGAGAHLDTCPTPPTANCLAAFHYLVFVVDGDTVTVKVILVPASLGPTKKTK